jgi:hypothetical protein
MLHFEVSWSGAHIVRLSIRTTKKINPYLQRQLDLRVLPYGVKLILKEFHGN